jgi:predicted ATPase
MPINKLIVKNYKSLKNLQLEMKPFMVFIGPNNAGKSNIFDCLRFLSDSARKGRDWQQMVNQKGGFKQIVYNGNTGDNISIELQGLISAKNKERYYKYFIEFDGKHYNNIRNISEIFTLVGKVEKHLLKYPVENDEVIAINADGKQSSMKVMGEQLNISRFDNPEYYPILGQFSREVQNWAFFHLLPPLMREPSEVLNEFRLRTMGENISTMLHTLQSESRQRFHKIEETLKEAVPELEELTTGLTQEKPSLTYIRIKEKYLKTSIPVWNMSDGTIRLLGYLATIYSPVMPPLICIEEPENYVHPRLLELIVDLIKTASQKTQVFVTTHSPYLIDFLKPEDLFIVEKKKGQTIVDKAEDKKGIKEALRKLGLGEMWYAGSLGGVP